MSNGSAAGRIGVGRDITTEFEAALSRVRREASPHGTGQSDKYGPSLTAEAALALFTERQDAYARSIEHGLVRLEKLRSGEELSAGAVGTEPWPELTDRLAGYRFPKSKRVVDIVLALVMLVTLSPLLVAVAIAIRLSSPGPAFYRVRRLGENGRPIRLAKFRTMRHWAAREDLYVADERNAGLFKMRDDERVTPIGRFLRRTSLDELPQLFNVLWGDLSLVGPPALPPESAAMLESHASRELLHLRPGITGPWQISRSAWRLEIDDMIRLEYLYAAKWSLAFDLKILLKTLWAVWRGRPAY